MSLNRKKSLSLLTAAVIVVGLGVAYHQFSAELEPLKLYGSIDMRTVDLAFEESGRLQSVLFEEGSSVKAGDLVAKLDDTRYKIARDQAASRVGVAQAQLTLLIDGT